LLFFALASLKCPLDAGLPGPVARLTAAEIVEVFLLLYLDLAYEPAKREHLPLTRERLYEAIVEGAAKRLRPKFMTFAPMTTGLVPILWFTGTGSEIYEAHRGSDGGWDRHFFYSRAAGLSAIYAAWRERRLNQEFENHSLEASGFLGPIPPCRAPDPSDTLKLSGLPCFRVGLPVAATQLNHPQRCCSLVRK
jgi:hypothetical protein